MGCESRDPKEAQTMMDFDPNTRNDPFGASADENIRHRGF